jgi:hypothetical protein
MDVRAFFPKLFLPPLQFYYLGILRIIIMMLVKTFKKLTQIAIGEKNARGFFNAGF